MTPITSVAETLLTHARPVRLGGLQRLLHRRRHVFRPGRASAGRKDARTVHGLDEGHVDGSSRRPL